MKHYDKDGKINFVDENNVFLGYDMEQSCCEQADWFIADRIHSDILPRNKRVPDLTAFRFDTEFFYSSEIEGTSIAVFRITDGETQMFIHLHNTHNGYYSHGFNFTISGYTRQEGIL